ncbi:MAG: hypothetical protein HY313_10555 [Acidobacteria bacterium]|nr:hypothetical protein [Acidobacteriota bacterium]
MHKHESVEMEVTLNWSPVLTKNHDQYCYPTQISLLSKSDLIGPGLYRWILHDHNGGCQFLVGEADNLRRRVRDYLKSTEKRHVRIRRAFQGTLDSGGRIVLEILRFKPFMINGIAFSEDRLQDPFTRRLLENLCCALLQQQGFDLLNETFEKRETKKRVKDALRVLQKTLPAKEFERVAREVRQGMASAVPPKVGEEGGFSR